jgi:hypothetical protein
MMMETFEVFHRKKAQERSLSVSFTGNNEMGMGQFSKQHMFMQLDHIEWMLMKLTETKHDTKNGE